MPSVMDDATLAAIRERAAAATDPCGACPHDTAEHATLGARGCLAKTPGDPPRICHCSRWTCPDCGIPHGAIPDRIDVRDPDDEIVAHRALVHLERMDRDHVWIGITTPDRHVAIDLHARRGRIVMVVGGDTT